MIKFTITLLMISLTPVSAGESTFVTDFTRPTTDFTKPEPDEENPAGAATTPRRSGPKAFSAPTPNLSASKEVDFKLGSVLFRRIWKPATTTNEVFTGLGPNYNARSCEACHVRDGRGHPPIGTQEDAASLFLKVGIPSTKDLTHYLATLPEPNYGTQMQGFATHGPAEYRLRVSYREFPIPLSDGQTVNLRQPTYHTDKLTKGPLHPDARLSPRVAPQMIGLGLIEAIAAEDILAGADPDDANHDGISGRANRVYALEQGTSMLGRFGLKAGAPTIRQQTAGALAKDMGISNSLIALDSQPPEIADHNFDFIADYSAQIGVPARENPADSTVLRGKQLFYQTGCIACHRPKFFTLKLPKRPELSSKLIWPYSDFLLHDMGAGLADGFPEGLASGTEWRTPPLWGIGLTQDVSGHTMFLHDGRARSLIEAVLWHGGEAQNSRDQVVKMPAKDRTALIRFLESL